MTKMEKEIKIAFKALSNKVVEEVSIKYFGDSETFISNDEILKEVKELHKKAESYALTQVFRR